MNPFIKKIHSLARKNPKRIVFPEGEEEITLKAIEEILKLKLAYPILIGSQTKIKSKAKKLKIKINFQKIKIVDPQTSKFTEKYIKDLYELRKEKGLTPNEAKKLITQDINYFGSMMVHNNDADGMITGTLVPTHDSLRPALQIIRTKEKFHKVSGIFFMVLEKRLLLFADAVVTITPDAHDLMDIAIDTAETARKFGIKPKIALLSFSTKGSNDHPLIDKIREAVAMIHDKRPDLIVDGELQVDSALVPEVARKKCPKSPIQGDANVLIFPDLQSANIAYKLVERLARAAAIGPLLQGLKKPVNDLSRGCSYKDIVDITAFTVCECNLN